MNTPKRPFDARTMSQTSPQSSPASGTARTRTPASRRAVVLGGLAALVLTACEGGQTRLPRKRRPGEVGKKFEDEQTQTVFGEGGLFGNTPKDSGAGAGGSGIGVNSYLWRASLDTISFMPVNSADPFGGVIITDWHSPAETPNERFKMNIYILSQALRADGIRVAVFRQTIDANGTWRDASVAQDAGRKIEDAVLTRARQLRSESTM